MTEHLIDAGVDLSPAEQAEVTEAETIEIEWDGRQWKIAGSYMKAPAVVVRGIPRLGEISQAGETTPEDLADAVDVVEALLGRHQFKRWTRGKRSTFADALDLLMTAMAAWGSALGE